MSTIDTLALGTSLDLSGLDKDLKAASDKVDAYFGTAGKKLLDMPTGAARVELPDVAKGLGGLGDLVAASLVTLGPRIQAGLQSALGPLSAKVGTIAATISRQLNDSFTFSKIQDGINTTKDLFEHDLAIMRRSFDAFGRAGTASGTAPFNAMQSRIKDAEFQLGKFLQHASASFKKGGFPALDTFFSKQSRTYRAGKGSDASGGLASQGPAFDRATKSMGLIRAATDRAKFSMIGFGSEVAAALGFFALGYKAVAFLKDGIGSASRLNETLSKTDAVLGSASEGVKAFASGLASEFGLVKGDVLDLSAGLGGLAKGLGDLAGKPLQDFTTKFTGLAADLKSFATIDLKSAGDALRIGLSGEQSDQLKRLGVVMTEQVVKAKAYALGIAAVGSQLTEAQKFAARAAVIEAAFDKLRIKGDLKKTLGGTQNQFEKLKGTITNLGTSIGQALLPAVNAGVVYLNEFATYAYKAFEDSRATIEAWSDAVVDSFDVVAAVVNNWGSIFRAVTLSVTERVANVIEWFNVLGPNAIQAATYINKNWNALMTDLLNATLAVLDNIGQNMSNLAQSVGDFFKDPTKGFNFTFKPLLDGFRATAEAFPGIIRPVLTDLSKEMADALDPFANDLAGRRARRAAAKLQPPGAVPDIAAKADAAAAAKDKKPFEMKFAEAAEIGTKEGYTGVIRALTGRGNDQAEMAKSGKKTADNTALMVGALGRIEKALVPPKPVAMVF